MKIRAALAASLIIAALPVAASAEGDGASMLRLRAEGRAEARRQPQLYRRYLRLRRAMKPQRKREVTTPLRPHGTRTRRQDTTNTPRKVLQNPREAVLEITNAERAASGLPPLRYNPLLERSAQAHAEDLHQRGYFSHVNPEGQNYHDRILATGYGKLSIETCNCKSYWVSFGENLAEGYADPSEVVRDWMNSPPHRKNILAIEFNEIGIGIAGDVWVQNFGRVEIEPLP